MPLSGHRILVVEDEWIIAFDVESIIQEAGGEVAAHAPSLAKALELAGMPNLSLAILDFRLGADNSLPVAAKLHARRVPFIFHTGSPFSEVLAAWPQVPAIAKPAAPAALVRTLVSAAHGAAPRRRRAMAARQGGARAAPDARGF